jgi:large subunit ribosomal protein L13
VPTYQPKAHEIQRAWHVVDADGMVLGRLASEVAGLLRGKHKPTFAPHVDCGDHVIVVNASKVVVTGTGKPTQKRYFRHSGYPGGLRSLTFEQAFARKPERVLMGAIKGMLPKNRLGRRMLKKLRVYAGPEHRHAAQQPQPYTLRAARRVEA